MPIEFSTSLDLDLVFARWSGEVDFAQFQDAFARYLSDAHYRPGRTELVDFSQVTELDGDFTRVWSMLRIVNTQAPGTVVRTRIVVIAPDDVGFGLARMFQSLAENAQGVQVEVYRTEEEAFDALALSYAGVDALLRHGAFRPSMPQARPHESP